MSREEYADIYKSFRDDIYQKYLQKCYVPYFRTTYYEDSESTDGETKSLVKKREYKRSDKHQDSTKTIETLFLSKACHTIFDEIDVFTRSEKEYKKRGIPYTRGYILYGPPGTGKSSVVKVISSMYKRDVVTIDISSAKSLPELKQLFYKFGNEFGSLHSVVVSFDDFDKSEMFQTYHGMELLYEFLDGIGGSTNGRIVIFTCNILKGCEKGQRFLNDKVLNRAGRINKQYKIDYADNDQIQRMLRKFYDDESITFDETSRNAITCAQVQDIILVNEENVSKAIAEIVSFPKQEDVWL